MSGKALIEVNKEALNESVNLDSLIEAVTAIMSSTEKDFEAMKSKAWYKRLWEMITFSQDNKKRLAKGVGSLAQMQDIIIKMILTLSRENPQIAKLAENNRDAINAIMERLNMQQDQLLAMKKALSHAVYYDRVKLSEIPPHDRRFILCAVSKYILSYPENSFSNAEIVNAYFVNLKSAIGIPEMPDSQQFDYTAIGELEDKKSDELYFTIICELTTLMDKSSEDNQLYSNAVEHISLSKPKQKQIWQRVEEIVRTEGKNSLVKGYYDDDIPSFFVDTDDIVFSEGIELEQFDSEQSLSVPPGEEVVIENKDITLKYHVNCEGKLIFKDCIIRYNGDNICGQIMLKPNSTLVLSQCTIIGDNNETGKEDTKNFFIKGNVYGSDIKTVKLETEKCLFLNCFNFAENVIAVFKGSVIRYRNISYEKRLPHYFLKGGGSEIYGCLFEAEENKKAKWQYGWLGYSHIITNCVFKNIKGRLYCWGSDSNKDEIKNSYFLNCSDILELKGTYEHSFNISDCLFENCLDLIKLTTHSKIENCQFLNCGDSFISGGYGDITIDHCDFIYVNNPTDQIYNRLLIGSGIYLHLTNDKDNGKGKAYIQNCYFNGIYHHGFIRYSFDKELSVFSKKIIGLTISDCKFKNCIDGITGVIDKKNYNYDYDDVAIAINNCKELDNTFGSTDDNPVIRKKTAYGVPIGTDITEEDVGVPLYQKALT